MLNSTTLNGKFITFSYDFMIYNSVWQIFVWNTDISVKRILCFYHMQHLILKRIKCVQKACCQFHYFPGKENYSILITLAYIFSMLCLCSLEELKCDHLSLILTALNDTAGTIVEKIDINYMKVQFILNITDSACYNAYSLFVT
jgi:hypothetical protein